LPFAFINNIYTPGSSEQVMNECLKRLLATSASVMKICIPFLLILNKTMCKDGEYILYKIPPKEGIFEIKV
jgi:hypothetical protein